MTAKSAFTGIITPSPDRFRPGDFWRGPNGRTYTARGLRGLPGHVCLIPVAGGPHVLMSRDEVRGFQRTKWGGKA
jgi:hypothetical protein